MTTLYILLPPISRAGGDATLRRWLARGDRLPDAPAVRAFVLRELFRFAGDSLPIAALRHHCHADDAATGTWLCADPAWVQSEATGARLMTCPASDLDGRDALKLAGAIGPLFGDEGMSLVVDTPSAWCVRVVDGAPLAAFTDPTDAVGVSLIHCLPEGEAGRHWRRLFTEAQVILHAHPVNAARAAAGLQPVNALWFWGAGQLPRSVGTHVRIVASADDALRGLARLAGASCRDPSPEVFESPDRASDALLDLDHPGQQAAGRAAAWLPYCQRWLRAGRFGAVELAFASGERFRIKRRHRWRFWRRA